MANVARPANARPAMVQLSVALPPVPVPELGSPFTTTGVAVDPGEDGPPSGRPPASVQVINPFWISGLSGCGPPMVASAKTSRTTASTLVPSVRHSKVIEANVASPVRPPALAPVSCTRSAAKLTLQTLPDDSLQLIAVTTEVS